MDGYKGDTQFSKALKAGVESGVYSVSENSGLLYIGHEQKRLCIPNIHVEGGREKGIKICAKC